MLQYIYTFFLGLFLAIFIGMGIAVFYESPNQPDAPTFSEPLTKEGELSEEQRQKDIQYQQEYEQYEEKMDNYNQNVAIIVIVAAVAVLAVSLIFDEKLGMLADGLLLGGIFTLFYGMIRGFNADDSAFRFIIATVALAATLYLGYRKFEIGKDT